MKDTVKHAIGLFVFSLILHLLLLPYFSSMPYFEGLSAGFTEVAKNYIEGRGFSEAIFNGEKISYQPAVWEAPGYSAFIIPIFLIFGQNNLYVKLAQALIYSIVPAALYLFFRKRLGEKYALLLGIFAAAYIPTIRLSTAILSEFLFGVLLLGSALLVLDKKYILAGLTFGAAVLTRDFGLMFIPAFFAYFLLNARSKNITHKQFFVFMAAFLILVAPWTARNYADYGHFAISAPKVGIALWEGIGEYDVGKKFDAPVYDGDVMARENAISFKYPSPFERDSARIEASLNILRENPVWYLSVMARRIPQLLFMNTGDPLTGELKREILHNFNLGSVGKLAGMMVENKSGLFQIFIWMEQAAAYLLAIFGAYYILMRKQAEYFIFPLVAATPLALLIMHVEPRYFTPVNYFVLFLAVYGLREIISKGAWHALPGASKYDSAGK